jgi:hypothetical protein
MLELQADIKGKSFSDGQNTTIALKTYLDENNNLMYKVIVARDCSIVEESEIFKSKFDAVVYFDLMMKEYKIS